MFRSAKDLFVELKETSRAGRIRLLSRKFVRTLEDTVGLEEYHCLVEQPVSSDSQFKLAALLSAVLVSLTHSLSPPTSDCSQHSQSVRTESR